MSELYQDFEGFKSACEKAEFIFVRPYGIYHKGEFYWDRKLPRKKGSVVRFFEDPTGPCLSLVILTMDGHYLCNAFPLLWHENDHPEQHALRIWLASLSEAERAEFKRHIDDA